VKCVLPRDGVWYLISFPPVENAICFNGGVSFGELNRKNKQVSKIHLFIQATYYGEIFWIAMLPWSL